MKHYRGFRNAGDVAVFAVDSQNNGTELDPGPSLKVFNHSPDGFEWGYGGSGPAQLALAILMDYLGDSKRAVELHQRFKWEFIAQADKESFDISEEQINAWMKDTEL